MNCQTAYEDTQSGPKTKHVYCLNNFVCCQPGLENGFEKTRFWGFKKSI